MKENLYKRSTPTRVGIPRSGRRPCPHPEVHPHACGDTAPPTPEQMGPDGPPPRVWGYRQKPGVVFGDPWSTPTRVGIPRDGEIMAEGDGVHPHACGDTNDGVCASRSHKGPPPRVWGYRASWSGSARCAQVHPHACGDTCTTGRSAAPAGGPPPRVWGYRHNRRRKRAPYRSTPTRVGIPSALDMASATFAVHPHACGDTHLAVMSPTPSVGPPPRVWGYHPCFDILHPIKRSTPTRVGIPSYCAGR